MKTLGTPKRNPLFTTTQYFNRLRTTTACVLICLALYAATNVLAQGPLVSGDSAAGAIVVSGETDSWTFTANTGDNIILRVGATNINPVIQLYAPGGALVRTAATSSPSVRDAVLSYRATNSGTFTAVISSFYVGGTSSYKLRLAVMPGAFIVPAGDEGGALVNGSRHTGVIELGDFDLWSFTANAGDSIALRAGATNFNPTIQLFGPNGELIDTAATASPSNLDASLRTRATNSGTFTVVVSTYYLNGTGTYQLHFAQAPGAVVISPGDEGGPITNGGNFDGAIDIGDLDVWSFSGNAGDNVVLRVGATNINPYLELFGPDGAPLATGATASPGNRDARVNFRLTNSGTFTVVVSSFYLNGAGAYRLHLAKAPGVYTVPSGDEGGALTNGSRHRGVIELGDLDVWSFTANVGDSIALRAGGTNLNPQIQLFGPDGVQVAYDGTSSPSVFDAWIRYRTTNSGTFIAVVSGYYLNGGGAYDLNFSRAPAAIVVSPGDEGGPLTNGGNHDGVIDLSDLDVWSFNGNAGDSVVLRVGATNINPYLELFGPDGALLDTGSTASPSIRDATVDFRLTNSGTFTVVVSSYYQNGTGAYRLRFAKSPGTFVVPAGDEGGVATNGAHHAGTLELGDLDFWSFAGNAGDTVVIRVGTTNFTPYLRFYGPDGRLVDTAGIASPSNRDMGLTTRLTNSGTFTVLLSSWYLNGEGTYQFHLAKAPGEILVPPGDEGGTMTNGVPFAGTITLGELDVWNFHVLNGESNVVRFTGTGFTPQVRLVGPGGVLLRTGISVSNSFTYVVTNEGFHTVVVDSSTLGAVGNYTIRLSRWAPDLLVPTNQVIDELVPYSVNISAADPDEPNKALAFTLLSGPPGMTLLAAGPTNATLSWTPLENQAPGTNIVIASVTDVANGKAYSRTNQFTIIVNEVNVAPQVVVPPTQTLVEQTTLLTTATVFDSDIPTNTFTFALLAPPAGMGIDTNTGAITWTPTEAQGPGSYLITVVVTDYNPPAVNAQHLSGTNTFTVNVTESNSPPQVIVPPTHTIVENSTLLTAATVFDSDFPTNTFTFALLSPPAGMSIDTNSGAISWVPTEAQGPQTYQITVVVTDFNPPAVNAIHLSATNSFTVIVQESNSPPRVVVPSTQTVVELAQLQTAVSPSDDDLPANTFTYALLAPPSGMTIDTNTGAITWTPTESQGPQTVQITVVVTDFSPLAVNAQRLSGTNSFTVIVTETNAAPLLQSIAAQSHHIGRLLSLQAVASDPDIPTNRLTFSLDSAPTNLTINATNGQISWIPGAGQTGTNTVVVRVTDDGVPARSDTRTFPVDVFGQPPRLGIRQLPSGFLELTVIGDTGLEYELQKSTNLVNWEKLLQFDLPASPAPYVDPEPGTDPDRNYRLKIVP